MGEFGKETKILLLAITTICVISFLLATGISFFLAKGFQQELLLHDYGVSGYQLNHTEKLLISAFTAQPNESDIARGKNALASIGYSSATSMQLLPMVQNYRNQTMWCLFLLLLFSFGTIYFALFLYLNLQHKAIREAEGKIREFLDGNTMSRIQLSQHCDMSSTIEKIKSQYSLSDGQIEANMNLLNIEGQLAGKTGVNQIYSIALILLIIVMLTCILMISSTLNSNVTQRTEFFGMLRCLGATKKQIMNFVRLEGLYWCKTAIPAGVALSIVVVWVTSAAMRKISPQWFAYMPTWGISWISIDSVLLESIKQNENVKRAYGRMFAYDVPVNIDGSNHKANVISYEANQFKWSADYLTAGSISVVEQEENQVLVVNTENTDVRVGDVITLSINGKEQAVTVAGILSDSPLAREEGTETIFCSEKTFVALTGQTGYTIIDVQFQNGASIEDVKDIENIFTDGGVVFTEQLSQVQQQRNLYSAFAVLVYGFLSIIVAITIFHIMNTINMGVIAKTKQYGTMRAIGMSNQQLIKMIVAEAMTYAVSGIILGCIIGLPMHWVVFASLITNFWGTAWSIPIFPLALIIGIVLFTSFLAVRSPAKRLHDMAIVDTIKSQQ